MPYALIASALLLLSILSFDSQAGEKQLAFLGELEFEESTSDRDKHTFKARRIIQTKQNEEERETVLLALAVNRAPFSCENDHVPDVILMKKSRDRILIEFECVEPSLVERKLEVPAKLCEKYNLNEYISMACISSE